MRAIVLVCASSGIGASVGVRMGIAGDGRVRTMTRRRVDRDNLARPREVSHLIPLALRKVNGVRSEQHVLSAATLGRACYVGISTVGVRVSVHVTMANAGRMCGAVVGFAGTQFGAGACWMRARHGARAQRISDAAQ